MTTPRHSLEATVGEQRRLFLQDIIARDGELTVTQAYEAAVAYMDSKRPQDKLFPGHYTNDRGELKPIPGAIIGYDEKGRGVVSPMTATQSRRRLTVYSADDLAKCDGKVGLAVGRVVDVVAPEQADTPAIRKVTTQHQEKSFTFSDGTVKKSCTAEGCLWGMPTGGKKKSGEPIVRKTHSDGLRVHESFGTDADDEVETSPDDTQELDPSKFISVEAKQATLVAGEETGEVDADDEETTRIVKAVDEAVAEAYGGK
jgi:hypothetical protein